MVYELYYWPSIQGRGEFVRLSLEEANASYVDVARKVRSGAGEAQIMRFLTARSLARPPFAPPFLKAGRQVISQTANILMSGRAAWPRAARRAGPPVDQWAAAYRDGLRGRDS